MRRHLLLVVVATLAVMVVGLPTSAAATTFKWSAALGSDGRYGTIAISAPGTGGGTAAVTLRHLAASKTYGMEVFAGTCSRRGAWLFPLKAQRTGTDGAVHVHLPLSAATMNRVRAATWGSGRMAVWLARSATAVTCSSFSEPGTPWPTPAATPTPPPPPSPTPTWTGDPIAAGTIDWDLARCPSAADIASVNADVPMTFLGDPTAGTLVCTAAAGSADLTRLQERVYQAILSMKRIHFDAPLPWTSKSLYDWFVGAIDGVTFDTTGGAYCCNPARVIHIQAGTNSIALTTNRWLKPSLVDRVGLPYFVDVLLHEARHSEGGYPHTCGNGDDNLISDMGAWAIVYYYHTWLALHGDPVYLAPPADAPSWNGQPPSAFYRQEELWYAQLLKTTRFCSEPH
jgi:hypothetical protein